jgi:hypothetical protein
MASPTPAGVAPPHASDLAARLWVGGGSGGRRRRRAASRTEVGRVLRPEIARAGSVEEKKAHDFANPATGAARTGRPGPV